MASKTSAQRVQGGEQRRKCMELRRAGLTYAAIGAQLGIDPTTAYEHVQKAMAHARETYVETAREHIDMQLARCEAMLEALEPTKADPRTVSACIAVMDHMAKLRGSYAPERREVSGALNLGNPFDMRAAIERDLKARANGNGVIVRRPSSNGAGGTNGSNGHGGNGDGTDGH